MEDRTGRVFLAVLLIVVGGFFSVVNYFPGLLRLEVWWPSFALLPGVAMLTAAIIGGLTKSRGLAAMVIPGCIVTMIGLILLFGNVTDHWEVWAYAWALIPASVGLGLVLASRFGVGDRAGEVVGRWFLAGGLTAFAFFGLLFEGLIFHGIISRYWPALLVLAGTAVLLAERMQRRS
jgi:hypothetical protein